MMKRSPIQLVVLVIALCTGAAHARPPGGTVELHPKLTALDVPFAGPFVRLADGAILCIDGDAAAVSSDDGKTWQRHPMWQPGAFKVRPEYAITRTRSGAVVCVFMDDLDKLWKWDKDTNASAVDARLFVWATRSEDGGKTWSAPVKVQDGYCGAVRNMIQAADGTLVVPLQIFLAGEHQRHATTPFYSTDEGRTWQPAGLLDTGGRGHHDGSIESAVVELKDGRIWMLLRTSLDWLYESFSTDCGRTWSPPKQTHIDASSSPAMIERLSNGQLMLAWNRLYPQGKTETQRRAGQHSQHAASWHREELAIAFSNDEGKTWSDPIVIARLPGGRVSYPFLFEAAPGEVWITTMQGGLRARLRLADL